MNEEGEFKKSKKITSELLLQNFEEASSLHALNLAALGSTDVAIKLLTTYCKQEDSSSCLFLGFIAKTKGDIENSKKYFNAACGLEEGQACIELIQHNRINKMRYYQNLAVAAGSIDNVDLNELSPQMKTKADLRIRARDSLFQVSEDFFLFIISLIIIIIFIACISFVLIYFKLTQEKINTNQKEINEHNDSRFEGVNTELTELSEYKKKNQ